jgi:hypothetical protein
MQTATTITVMLVRFTAIVQVVLGLLFWTGNLLSMIPVHMLIGFVFVLSLWTLSGLAAGAGVSPGLVALGLAWGLVVPVLGLTQTRILPGDFHWIVQVVHLLVGVIGAGIGDMLANRIGERHSAPVPA